MFTTTVETHPDVLSAAAVIRDPIVNRAGENLGYAESLIQKGDSKPARREQQGSLPTLHPEDLERGQVVADQGIHVS